MSARSKVKARDDQCVIAEIFVELVFNSFDRARRRVAPVSGGALARWADVVFFTLLPVAFSGGKRNPASDGPVLARCECTFVVFVA